MGGDSFEFKQFTIWQQDCAMKVCTDSCILGASANQYSNVSSILDIGSGTGLLSLMLAQHYPTATIDAVEINELAARQCLMNIASSPFANRIKVHHTSIQTFSNLTKQYDLIICNPPFYSKSLLSKDIAINQARHNECLTPVQLILVIIKMMCNTGSALIMLPMNEGYAFIDLAQQSSLWLKKFTKVRDTQSSKVLRAILEFSFVNSETLAFELYIKDGKGNYSQEFKSILQPFYTIF